MEQFANLASTFLSGSISSGATSLVVVVPSVFPSTGNFRILIDSEIMLVTAVSGSNFTVTRAQEGTTATAHNSGVAIVHVFTSGALAQFRADGQQAAPYASRPAAGNTGVIFRPTDGYTLYRDNGTTWDSFGPAYPLVQPPAAAGFTLRETGSNASNVDDHGAIYFSATSRGVGEDSILADQAVPGGAGSAFTLTVGFLPNFGGQNGTAGFFNFSSCGIALYEVASTKIAFHMLYNDITDDFLHLQLGYKTSLTGAGSITGGYDVKGQPINLQPCWLRITDDGLTASSTNRTWSYSNDGKHFVSTLIQGRAFGFTTAPDRVGIYLNPLNADAAMTVVHYSLTSP